MSVIVVDDNRSFLPPFATMPLPLVYACSGCSNAGQLANALALRLHRETLAEMSCIVGVGGAVPALIRIAQRERAVLALDGCLLRCVGACLDRIGRNDYLSINLADHGIKKARQPDFAPEEAEMLWQSAILPALDSLLIPPPQKGATTA